MNRKEIAVLAKKKTILNFLNSFFERRSQYKCIYYKEPESLLHHIKGKRPSAILCEETLLSAIAANTTKIPCLAIISGNAGQGVETAVNCNAKGYLYKPYIDKDLEYKLEALIIENNTLNMMEIEMKELEAIIELMQLLSSTLDPKDLLYKIVQKIAELIPVTRCSIIKVDWLYKSAFVVASFEDPQMTGLKLNLKKYPEILEALSGKQPVVINNTMTDPLMQKVREIIAPLGIRSILVLPIFFLDKVIGTLFLRTSRKGHVFTDSEIRFLKALSQASSNALHNAFLFEQVEDEKTRLEKLAITDFLTGIYNIRYFYNRIIEEFSRSERYKLPISCLMLDIDFFKHINDAYGHKTGDQVLREFAQILKKFSRKSDVLARYGGEEFVLLLPQTALEGAISEAERLRIAIKNHKFKSLKNKSGITVSVGVATYPNRKIKTHDELISSSDTALFIAKKGGRDQVAVAGKKL